MRLTFLLLLCTVTYANENLLILEEIQREIISDYKLSPQTQTITVIKKTPSQGEQRVQEQLKKNRSNKKGKSLTGKEKIQQMLEKNRARVKKMASLKSQKKSKPKGDWMQQRMNQQNKWISNKSAQIKAWEKKKKEIIAKWYKEKKRYQKRVPQYKESLKALPAPPIPPQKIKKITKEIPPLNEYFLISKAFEGESRDQGKRPTCAAFAGVRAIEILLARNGTYHDLSEQYFFWASLPDCKSRKCGSRGSWVLNEYKASQRSPSPDIPLEDDCPYNPSSMSNNVNQIPLRNRCRNGIVQVKRFKEVLSEEEILHSLKNDSPVIAGLKLSENFYYNTGYIFQNKKLKFKVTVDQHAAGHAVLFVGYMKLPKELHQNEGSYCLITANSWGTGWGKGGHACVSQRWFQKHRYNIPFIALQEIKI